MKREVEEEKGEEKIYKRGRSVLYVSEIPRNWKLFQHSAKTFFSYIRRSFKGKGAMRFWELHSYGLGNLL
jgi:hypothetical protein